MSISKTIQNIPPVLVLFLSLMIGVALALSSAAVHVSVASFANPTKQLGYFSEINWSLNFILFVPLALFFFASSFNCIRSVIRDLASAQMIVDANGQPIGEAGLQGDWEKTVSPFLIVGVVLGGIGMIASWIEWWNNFHYTDSPLADVLAKTQLAKGWNLAPLSYPPPHHLLAAKIFGLAAYTMQGTIVASYFCFLCVIYGFATWLYNFTTNNTPSELLPDTGSNDTRRGFENFEPMIETLMFAALACFGIVFLTRLDHAFLQSSSATFGEFVQNDIWWGFVNGVKNITKASADLFQVADIGYSVAMVGAGLILTLVTAFFIPTIILRQAARESRQRAIQHFRNDPEKLNKLHTMTFWPMLYPTPIQLLGFLFLAAMCFAFFKLTLVLVGAAILVAITKLVKLV